tara:strand:+ start:157 stop:1026 length:870 start_codon:yes stop_codon:yes gene_type:complete
MIKISVKKDLLDQPVLKTKFLKPKKTLHPKFWKGQVLSQEVSKQLLEIADSIIQSMDIEVEIDDIIITGSIASYNWHMLSDIDLHIVFDFKDINNDFELVKRMLDQSRINWNKTHDIRIFDHEVELYFQDTYEPHESNGIWSLQLGKWLAQPVRLEPELDLRNTEKKAEMLVKSIDHVSELVKKKDYQSAYDFSSKIKNKISNMRKAGLSRDGIYSPENLAFKMLRHSGYLERLSFLKILSYDKTMSLNEMYIRDYFNTAKDPDYLEFGDGGGVDSLLDETQPAPWETN